MAVTYDLTGALPAGVTVAGANGSTVTWTEGVGCTVIGSATNPPCIKITDSRTSDGWQQITGTAWWLVLEMSTSAGSWAGVYDLPVGFDYVQEGMMKTYSIPIKADGQTYKYNRALGDYYAIPRTEAHTQVSPAADPINAAVTAGTLSSKGKLTKFNSKFVSHGDGPLVWLNEVRGSTGVLKSLKISDVPEGPTNLVCEIACPAEAMHRVGSPGRIMMRVHNLGGRSASRFELTWTDTGGLVYVPSSFRLGDKRSRIRPGEDRTFHLRCTPAAPATTVNVTTKLASFKTGIAEITCAQGSSTGPQEVRVWADPPLSSIIAAEGPIQQDTFPATVFPPASDVIVECYRFPVWVNGGHHVSSIVSSAERRPSVGYTSIGMPDEDWASATAEERAASLKCFEAEQKIAAEHGIRRWVVEWFVNTRPQNKGWMNSVKHAANKDDVEWYICYVNTAAGEDGKSNVSCWVGALDLPNGVDFVAADTGPVNGVGAAGSFHYNRANARLYGPKVTSEAWDTVHYVQAPAGTPDVDIYYSANWLHHFEEVIPHFSLSNYTKVNGKPRYDFLAVESSQHWFAGLYKQVTNDDRSGATIHTQENDDWVASLVNKANSMAVAAGWTSGMEWGGGAAFLDASFWVSLGMVHTCSYNWHFFTTPCSVRTAIETQEIGATRVWQGMVSNNTYNAGMFAALTTTTGFNHERWSGRLYTPEAVVTGWTYDVMKDHIKDALAKVRTRAETVGGIKRRVIRLSAWDEDGEGSSMRPNAVHGYTFVRALYEALYESSDFPTVITHEERGLTFAPMETILWAQMPTANPVADGTEAVTTQGVTMLHRLYPAYEMEPSRTVCVAGVS